MQIGSSVVIAVRRPLNVSMPRRPTCLLSDGALDVDMLAARVHCSRATIYRHAGGKNEIRDAVVARAAARIVEAVRLAVDGLSGAERIATAITVALGRIRADPLGQLMINSIRGAQGMTWLTESPVVAEFATDLNGLTDDDSASGAVDHPCGDVDALLAHRRCRERTRGVAALRVTCVQRPVESDSDHGHQYLAASSRKR